MSGSTYAACGDLISQSHTSVLALCMTPDPIWVDPRVLERLTENAAVEQRPRR